MTKRVLLSLLIPLVGVLSFSLSDIYAAGSIPRNDLRLELLLATGTQDTSGNNRVVTLTGASPTYSTDALYGITAGTFNGYGGLLVNTAWASSIDNYSISFWIKSDKIFLYPGTSLTGNTIKQNINPSCLSCPDYNYNQDTYITTPGQTIFSSGPDGNIKFILNSGGKCSLRGGNVISTLSSVVAGQTRTPGGSMVNYYANKYLLTDIGTNFQESFNCSQLLDKKWHNIVIMKKNATILSLYIDGVETAKLSAGVFSIGKNITIGHSTTDTNYFSGKFISSQIKTINDSKKFVGSLAGFRIYSRSLNDNELEAIFDEFRYAQSELAGASNVQVTMEKYNKPNLFLRLRNIAPNLSRDNVTYEYTTDKVRYAPITDITDLSSSTGSLEYRIGMDLSGVPDGKITLNLRVRGSDGSFQNIGTASFVKLDISTGIAINMPNSDQASSKTISAEAPGANLTMLITSNTVCDATIGTGSFETYSDITFTNQSDNGKRVCYRAVYPTINKVVYRLSDTIQGILGASSSTTNSLFENYTYWVKSIFKKPNDSMNMILDLLGVSPLTNPPMSMPIYNGNVNGITMTDINGDGLVDFIYSMKDPIRRAVIINNGNFTFRIVYKCVMDPIKDLYNNITGYTYYGDCADPSR